MPKVWIPPSIAISPFISLFPNPPFLTFVWQYHTNEIEDIYKNNLMRESCFFMFRRLLNKHYMFFLRETLCATPGLIWNNNNLGYQKEFKEKLPSKEHCCCYKIHLSLMKSSAYLPPNFYDFSKMATPNK